ncbi:MAG TPA: hypothetical protein VJV23_04005 [Candidatus Polarisedimenticolia bacterium]|nr:hypothetical protein [Candidatus Polarisedimenticolia bacterium]
MRTGAKIALGCLATPFVALLLFVLLFLVFRTMPLPESRMTTAQAEAPGVSVEALKAEGLSPGDAMPAQGAMPVNIRLEEGTFTVRAAPAGEGFKVEGKYDEAMYTLEQQLTRDSAGAAGYTMSFRPKYSTLRRLLSQGFLEFEDGLNAITVYLPQGVPMDLRVHASKGQSNLQLGGLALRHAELDLRMGEHSVSVASPNLVEMDELKVNGGMGELDLGGLGNLRAGSIVVWGRMGELGVDVGPEVDRDTKLFVRMRMGEMRVGLPPDARVQARSSVFLGDSRNIPHRSEGKHLIEVDAGMSLGEMRFNQN